VGNDFLAVQRLTDGKIGMGGRVKLSLSVTRPAARFLYRRYYKSLFI
jgi:hypothetical protein